MSWYAMSVVIAGQWERIMICSATSQMLPSHTSDDLVAILATSNGHADQ